MLPLPFTTRPANDTAAPLRVSEKSLTSTPDTGSLKLIVTLPTAVLRGSGEISTMSAAGPVESITQLSTASCSSALLEPSIMPDAAAFNVSTYRPSTIVTPDRSMAYVSPEPLNGAPASGTLMPFRVKVKSLGSTPVTAEGRPVSESVNSTITWPTGPVRGSGVTFTMSASGASRARSSSLSSRGRQRFPLRRKDLELGTARLRKEHLVDGFLLEFGVLRSATDPQEVTIPTVKTAKSGSSQKVFRLRRLCLQFRL